MTSRSISTVPFLVSPAELKSLQAFAEPPIVLDGSWHLPSPTPRHGFTEFKTKRIPGAAFWDVDIIATKDERNLSHMMPSSELFADACSRLGISRDSHVVVYDSTSVFSSPRTAFTFKAFGHPKVSILDGGLPRWIAENNPIETELPSHPNPHEAGFEKASYGPILSVLLYDKRPGVESYFIADIEENGMKTYEVPELDPSVTVSYEDVVKNLSLPPKKADVIIDARPAARFTGAAPEPRAGLESGHMPNSVSIPFSSLLSPPSDTTPPFQTVLPPAEIEQVFIKGLGAKTWEKVKAGSGVITSCGSGMTAALVWLGLQLAGRDAPGSAIFDEAWTGYASRKESKIVKSA